MVCGFRQKFPDGTPTYFREKILLPTKPRLLAYGDAGSWYPKLHTLRAGNRWKVGMSIQMATGVRTKQYEQFNKGIPELEKVKSVQSIVIKNLEYLPHNQRGLGSLDRRIIIDGITHPYSTHCQLARNDGFNSVEDFYKWFDSDFEGQIIHWSDLRY